ncbi:unnamed protein product [Parascedosporium putredinis]|uniref:Short-chain dehydrogenase/reductase 3 n=1 Tax=Parascedosporium putredinis TaxID=1442378 RepID=A0A9P1H827_9PEZI|nr:unnamed protein product [Parascedosporium putredinis]CAI8000536.1 unnamed protein product [Parascedosporium putredinis]
MLPIFSGAALAFLGLAPQTLLDQVFSLLPTSLSGEQGGQRCALNNWRLTGHPGWEWEKEVAVVTGGCSGIGKEVVLGLVANGVRVAILDVQPLPKDLEAIDAVHYWACDISSPAAVKAAADEIRSTLGNPSILINNAGMAFKDTILDASPDRIQKIVSVNLVALWWTTREFLPAMITANKGHIFTVASMASYVAMPMSAHYAATKSGALSFHEALRSEIKHMYKAPGVLTTAVHPMWVKTDMTAPHAEDIERHHGPMMMASDIANPIVKQVLDRRGGHLLIPGSGGLASGFRGFPSWLQEAILDRIGKNTAAFKGS